MQRRLGGYGRFVLASYGAPVADTPQLLDYRRDIDYASSGLASTWCVRQLYVCNHRGEVCDVAQQVVATGSEVEAVKTETNSVEASAFSHLAYHGGCVRCGA